MNKTMSTSRVWDSLSTQERAEAKNKICGWLQKNYVQNNTVCLPCDSLYHHAKQFCRAVGIPGISASHFGRVLCENFKGLGRRRLGKRGVTRRYYKGIDIRPTSDAYVCMSNERKDAVACNEEVATEGDAVNSDDADQINSTLDQDIDVKNASKRDNRLVEHAADSEDVLSQPLDTDRLAREWNAYDSDKKKSYWPLVLEWLNDEYEVSPRVCLPRDAVYAHFALEFRGRFLPVAPHFLFGKVLRQKFKNRVDLRRLGQRGSSKYYYMGIDVQKSSSFYRLMCSHRIEHCAVQSKKNQVNFV